MKLTEAATLLCAVSLVALPCLAAENLRLRDGISYTHDLDKGFPILGDHMDDVKVEAGKNAFIFFGAAGDLNTNRQAKRVVELYRKQRATNTKFIVIDVDHADSADAKHLLKTMYQGYIPFVVIVDKQGKTTWSHAGETDQSTINSQLDKVLD